ncbi:MAG TPA: CoA ester lyase [Bacilli bacterium]
MRRSLLFIPGNNPGMIQNALLFGSDAVIFDLEDAVAISEKDSARELVKSYLNDNELNIEVIVRINDFHSDFYIDDLKIVSNKIDALMIPKARFDDLLSIDHDLEVIEKDLGKKIKLIPIIELASSLIEVEKIVTIPRVDGLLLGAEDLTSDMEISRTDTGFELQYPRSRISFAAKAYKIDAIDTPYPNINREDMLRQECDIALSLGMNAKACIHPNQIAIVNEKFSPSKEAINYALKVIEASQKASGAFSLEGKMIDKPIIERCEKIIMKAKKFGLIS